MHRMGSEDSREGMEAEEIRYGRQPPTPLGETPSGLDAEAQRGNAHALASEGQASTTPPGDNTSLSPPISKPRPLPKHDFLRTVLASTESTFCEGLNLRTPTSPDIQSQASSSSPEDLSNSAQALPAERRIDHRKYSAPIREQEVHPVVQQGQAEYSPTITRDSTTGTHYSDPSPDMEGSSDLPALVLPALVAWQTMRQGLSDGENSIAGGEVKEESGCQSPKVTSRTPPRWGDILGDSAKGRCSGATSGTTTQV